MLVLRLRIKEKNIFQGRKYENTYEYFLSFITKVEQKLNLSDWLIKIVLEREPIKKVLFFYTHCCSSLLLDYSTSLPNSKTT